MNVVTPLALAAPAAASADSVEMLAAWPVAPGALLLLGRGAAPAAEGEAQLERRRVDRGPYRAWVGRDGFCVAVRLPGATVPQPGQVLVLGGAVALCLPAFADAVEFAAVAAALAGPHLAEFLLATFPDAALERIPAAGAMLADYLGRVLPQDGVVELAGVIPEACVLLQGWGPPLADGTEAVLLGPRVRRFAVTSAVFERRDVMRPATGTVLVLPDAAAPLLAEVAEVVLVSAGGITRRPLVSRRLLDREASVGHVRDMLPMLRCAPAVADRLRAALRARYEGRETLAGSGQPVRAALDLAVAGGGTAYLSGWLFDPTGAVVSVTLRDAGGAAVRLDTRWTRIARADVSDAFAGSLPDAADAMHGFAVHAPGGASGDGAHLELAFQDQTCAFVPVSPVRAGGAVARLLDSVDLFKPTGLAVIADQLAPAFVRLDRPDRAGVAGVGPGRGLVIAVALTEPGEAPRALLSGLMHDPLAADERLVLACSPGWSAVALARLRDLCRAAGVAATIVESEGGALAAALDVSDAGSVLLVAASVAAEAGWRLALREALGARTDACLCPSVLHEDGSLRAAGGAGWVALDAPPWTRPSGGLAGLPASLLPDGAVRTVAQGSLACCLLPRALLARVGVSAGGLTAAGREALFFHRLREVGGTCLWAPRIRVHAPERQAPDTAREKVARLVDQWRIAHAYGHVEEPACAS